MASITASSLLDDEAYALSLSLSPSVSLSLSLSLSPVKGSGLLPNGSLRQCQFVYLRVCISVRLLNKLFLIGGEERRAVRRLVFQKLPVFPTSPHFTRADYRHYPFSCVFSYHSYSELTLSFVLLHCLTSDTGGTLLSNLLSAACFFRLVGCSHRATASSCSLLAASTCSQHPAEPRDSTQNPH